MPKTSKAVIVGAGLSGLTLALALLQRGFEVEVLEGASKLEEVGDGLTLYGASVRVFDSLGLWEPLRAASNSVEGMDVLDGRTGASVMENPPPAGQDWASKSTSLDRTVHIHRADLQAILLKALSERAPGALRLGGGVAAVTPYGPAAAAILADGERVEGDVLVGCDGLRSGVRRSLFGPDALTFSGHVAHRSVMPRAPAAPYLGSGRAALYIGPGRFFQRYGLRDGAILNVVAVARTDAWREEGWRIPASREEVLGLFDGWCDDVMGVLRLDSLIKQLNLVR